MLNDRGAAEQALKDSSLSRKEIVNCNTGFHVGILDLAFKNLAALAAKE